MTNQELADDLNTTLALTGEERIAVDVIRQWVSWRLLPKAIGRGRRIGLSRTWERDVDGHETALRLAELRKAGLRSKDALLAQTWIDGGHVEFDVARVAILRRFESALRKANRTLTTNFDPRDRRDISVAKKRAVLNQVGRQADVFLNSPLELSDDEKIASFAATRFGGEAPANLTKIAARVVAQIVPDGASAETLNGMHGLTGILGSPEEIADSGIGSLRDATDGEFELARRVHNLNRKQQLLSASPEVAALVPIEAQALLSIGVAAHSEIFVGDWATVQFVAALHQIHTDPMGIAKFSELVSRHESEFDMVEGHFKTGGRGN